VRAETLDRAWGPELVNRFFDVLTVQKSASTFLLDGLSLVLSAGIGMLVLAFYHPVLLAFDIVLIASVVGLLWGLGRRGPKTAIYESKAKYRVAAWLEDLARSGATFRSPYGSALASSRADELARAYLSARRESFKVVFRQYAGVLALQAIATAVLLGLGGWLVVVRQLTLGQLVASELIVATVVSNLSKLGRKIDAYYDLLAAVDKLGHLVDLPLEPARGGAELPRGSGPARLAVDGLHYAYEGGATLDFPSFEVFAGERVAIVGGAGSGKSTLADVLYGLRAPGAGSVEIDGVDARSLPAHVLRAHVGLVRATDALVFEGTLAENVALGRPEVGHAEARAALEAVGLAARVRALPQGVGTQLAATGAPLASTDLRRVTIARAIAASPRLLVVDGGVAGLDAEARAAVQSALLRIGAPWTLIVLAAPDDPLVGLCDRVLRLDVVGPRGGYGEGGHA
jgi:ABC-type bacteriocin/lantibiotic exporter with double-glycine peptidase domain